MKQIVCIEGTERHGKAAGQLVAHVSDYQFLICHTETYMRYWLVCDRGTCMSFISLFAINNL